MDSTEAERLQAQIDLMSQLLVSLTSEAKLDRNLKRRMHLAAAEMAKSANPGTARGAAEWGAKWFPHEPFMDDPMNQ